MSNHLRIAELEACLKRKGEYISKLEGQLEGRCSDSYDTIDRYLRNNLYDDDYADMSMELDRACGYARVP